MDIAQLHFLVAEGDPVQRQMLVHMLARLGARAISEVTDGHAALLRLDCAIEPAIDIGLIDLSLPGLDGLDLIRHLGQAERCPGIVIVGAQSSTVLFSVETMAHAYGIDLLGTIAKPVTEHKLDTLIALYRAPAEVAITKAPQQQFTYAEVALALQAGQFEPFFQPMIELQTGHVKGLEIFARWVHPQFGVLGPAAFMGVLEENDQVACLDWSMIEKSVAACRQLHDQAIPISISINLALCTLLQPSFLAQVNACLVRHQILADYVTFEMPESAVLTTDPQFLECLLRLRMQGFGLAIDDYGTGRSNLQLLARIPFSELKIDRSFVDGASKKHALGTVLGSFLGLARSLDRRSAAVGVETKEDWDFLQKLGCTYAQGYYIANPMALQEFPAWLEDWRHFF